MDSWELQEQSSQDKIERGFRLEDYHDEITNALGPIVKLVRTTTDGDIVEEMMPALLAHIALMDDEDNGTIFVSGHIEHGSIIDRWGSSI